ncbi:MAG: tetratricopeptide repeat protein [Blastocatellia bacterium]
MFLYNLEEYDRAAGHFIQLIEGFPKSPHVAEAHARLAQCYGAVKKRREAISELESLLAGFPGAVDARKTRLEIADLYFDMDDLRQARTEYQKVLRDKPYDTQGERAWLQIGGIGLLLGEIEDALAAFQTVVTNTTDAEIKRRATLMMVDCYQRVLQYEDAVKLLEQLPSDPKDPGEIKHRIEAVKALQKQRGLNLK